MATCAKANGVTQEAADVALALRDIHGLTWSEIGRLFDKPEWFARKTLPARFTGKYHWMGLVPNKLCVNTMAQYRDAVHAAKDSMDRAKFLKARMHINTAMHCKKAMEDATGINDLGHWLTEQIAYENERYGTFGTSHRT